MFFPRCLPIIQSVAGGKGQTPGPFPSTVHDRALCLSHNRLAQFPCSGVTPVHAVQLGKGELEATSAMEGRSTAEGYYIEKG